MRILFAVDLSEPRSLTQRVEQFVKRIGGDLLVLHVHAPAPSAPVAPVDPMSGLMGFAPYSVYDPTLDQNIEKAEENAYHAFLVERFEMPLRAASREGDPAEMILQDAEEESADIIVLGKRHQSKLRRLLVGSIAGEVVRQATLPVVLFPVLEERESVPTRSERS